MELSNNRDKQPRVGISACLLGENVRYDGGHKYHQLIHDQLSPWLNLIPFCPEAEAELGIPRPPVNLIQTGNGIRALGAENPTLNVTNQLINTSRQFAADCELVAYIVKTRSPSCGNGSTPLFNPQNQQLSITDGLFVQALKEARPEMLIVDEEWLNSENQCENFLAECYKTAALSSKP